MKTGETGHHDLSVGQIRYCMDEEKQVREAVVLRISRQESKRTSCYVHFVDEDNRMDSWLDSSRIFELVDHGSSKNKRHLSATTETTAKRVKMTVPSIQEKERVHSHMRNVDKIYFYAYDIRCWYYSAYPVARFENLSYLFICHKTFKYIRKLKTYKRHLNKIKTIVKPPGRLFYSDPSFGKSKSNIEVYEVHGTEHPLYCQNLCLFSKLFIEHKNTRYDPKPFVFNVLIERYGEDSFVPVGYFSREKHSEHNLSCILVFPPFQKRGYGRFLISLSYAVSRKLGLVGSPEKPLSDLGKISYRSFWTFSLLSAIQEKWKKGEPGMSLKELSRKTYIRGNDILSTFAAIGFIKRTKVGLVTFFEKDKVKQCLEPFVQSRFGESLYKAQYFLDNDLHSQRSAV